MDDFLGSVRARAEIILGDRKKGICAVRQKQPFQFALLLTLLVASAGGCNSFGNSRLVKELQSENDRLLAEFRAQRNRSEELEKANRLQAERLAESEKLLARMTQGTNPGRLSSLPQSWQSPSPLSNTPGQPFSATSDNIPSLGNNGAFSPNRGSSAQPDSSSLRWLPRAPGAR